MKTLADRLQHLVKLARAEGVTVREFSVGAGLKPTYISSYLTRAKDDPGAGIQAERLHAIAERWNTDPEWLLRGKGASPTRATIVAAKSGGRRVPEIAVEREEPESQIDEREGNPLQRAIGAAFDSARHTIVDVRRVDDLMTDLELKDDVDLVAAAKRWLDAAAALRREGVPFSAQAMILRLAVGSNGPAAASAAKARGREQLDALDALAPRTPMDDEEPRAPETTRVLSPPRKSRA